MNNQPIDLTHSLRSGHSDSNQELVTQALEKFDVNLEEMKKEVNILNFEILKSKEKDKNCIFVEFQSVSYKILFVTYNVEWSVRLLTFQNDNQSQILKLDIQTRTTNLKKEIEYGCNLLQRRRNLNLMFKTLITFSRFIESRRLICDLILKKNRNIAIEQNKDGGIIIVYTDEKRNVRLGIFWSIACSSTHEVTDVMEVYYKVVELPNKSDIKRTLNLLTGPCLDFTEKYHLWKLLIDDLSERTLLVMIDKLPDTSKSNKIIPNYNKEVETHTIAASDSAGSSRQSLLVVLDKMSTTNKIVPNYNKEVETHTIDASDSAGSFRRSLLVVLDKMSTTNRIVSNYNKEVEAHTVATSDSAGSTRRSLLVVLDKMSDSSLTEKEAEGVYLLSSDSDDALEIVVDCAKEQASTEPVKSSSTVKATDQQAEAGLFGYLQLQNSVKTGEDPERSSQIFATTKPLSNHNNILTNLVNDRFRLSKDQEDLDIDTESSDSGDSIDSEDSRKSKNRSEPVCSSGDEYKPEEATKTPVMRKRRYKSESAILARRSPRISSVNTEEKGKLLTPKISHFLQDPRNSSVSRNTSKQVPLLNVATSTVSPNKGLIFISDNPLLLNSVVPNNVLKNFMTPKKGIPIGTPPPNVRVRLVPDEPVSSSPSFVELNFPIKRPKTIDDDGLEITSVTYVVPD